MSENLNFDTARAIAWKRNVDEELVAVSTTLKRVGELCTTVPGEDDSLIKILVKIGEAEQEAWNRLTDAFKTVSNETDNVINRISKGIQNAAEKVGNMLSGFKL